MIPRIFVSSTYYDLRHVRERLEKFINGFGFEAILFESDKVTYQHGKEIDHSAYYEVGLCHMMVLIIGGRYGSPSSQSKIEEERKKYDEDYISITRQEFETASFKNMPVLIFVDKNVYSEYQTYKENQEFFDNMYSFQSNKDNKDNRKFKFAHVDHINVFKFIDSVRIKPIKTFDKVEEIETYVRIQLSGMFYLYLESLKQISENNKVLNTISELNNVTLRMNEMLNSVGKQILGKDLKEYEKVIENQLDILLSFFFDKFKGNIDFQETLTEDEIEKIDIKKVAEVIYEKALICPLPAMDYNIKYSDMIKRIKEFTDTVLTELQIELLKISEKLKITKFNFRHLNEDLRERVIPLIKNEKDKRKLMKGLEKVVYHSLFFPF